MISDKQRTSFIGSFLLIGVFLLGGIVFLQTLSVRAANVASSVIVGNSAPVTSAVTLNGASAITLTVNATTSINVSYTISDNNGCSDVFTSGYVTTTVFRSGVLASCTASNLNCYVTSTVTSNNCSGTSGDATTTIPIWYFAEATDASSSYANQQWVAQVTAADSAAATGSATSTHVELNTLTGINVTTSSVNYGSVSANTNTGAVNQAATTTNAGNSSTTLQVYASATLTSGANSISTSSQHYASSSFTFGGAERQLSATAATVTGFVLLAPTSTTAVQRATFWGLTVTAGTATGTYSGTNVFSALFQP